MLTNSLTNRGIANVFLWMFAGLFISAATAAAVQVSGLEVLFWSNWAVPLILAVLELGLVFVISWCVDRLSTLTMQILFVLYSVVSGITLSAITTVYADTSVALAFGLTAVYFLALAVIGYTTRVDLSRWRTVLLIGLLALIITEAVMLFFPIPMMERIISAGGLLLFSAMTAYDVQRMKGVDWDGKWVIFYALSLYLDFINLFIYILELMGDRK